MTKAQVRSIETDRLITDNEEQLIYRGVLVGRDCSIFYDFKEGALTCGTYYIDSPNDVDDVAAYEELVDLLRTKYGAPDTSGLEWSHVAKRVRVETYGELAKAIAAGEVEIRSVWETLDTRIVVVCTEQTEQYNAILMALYFSQEDMKKVADNRFHTDLELI